MALDKSRHISIYGNTILLTFVVPRISRTIHRNFDTFTVDGSLTLDDDTLV